MLTLQNFYNQNKIKSVDGGQKAMKKQKITNIITNYEVWQYFKTFEY